MASLEELLATSERGSPAQSGLAEIMKNVPAMGGFFGGQEYDAKIRDQERLRGKIATSDREQQVMKDIIKQANGDHQAAVRALAATGTPEGLAMAEKVMKLASSQQNMSLMGELQKRIAANGGQFTPEDYRTMGTVNLLTGNHAASAPLFAEADRTAKLAQEKTALEGMRSTPAIAPDVQENQQAADQGTPIVPAVPARLGAVPQYLMESKYVGKDAIDLQRRINAGSGFTSVSAEKAVENLQAAHRAMTEREALVAQRGEEARKTKMSGIGPDGMLTDEAKNSAAARYNIDGTLPTNLGRGNQGAANTVSILNRAAAQQKAAGNDAEAQRIQQISGKTATTALQALQKDLAAIGPFHDMLNTNAKIAIDLAKKISSSRTGSQFANRPITWLQSHAGDNPDIAEYLFQIQTVKTEGARLLNNPRLVGQLTDTARIEMGDVINGNMPLGQTERVLKRMMSDGDNRVNAMLKQKEILLQNMRITPTPKPAVQAPSSGQQLFDAADAILNGNR